MRSLTSSLVISFLLAACGGSSGPETCRDADGDGYGDGPTCLGLDCDDTDAEAHPGAEERVGDGIDTDCNNLERCFADADDDGVRTDTERPSADATCDDPGEAYASEPAGDCDDVDALTFPGASEITGDGRDQSCDGRERCYLDADGDGARSTAPLASLDADCDDVGEALASARIDCDDASVDDTPFTFYVDADGDRHGAGGPVIACAETPGLARDATDCDDTDATAWVSVAAYVDADGDGAGVGDPVLVCQGLAPPLGFALEAGDCAPEDPTARPGAPELPDDGIDQDCAGGDLVADDTTGIFVRLGASDTNDGTRASPVGSLARALAIAEDDDVLFVAAGDYDYDVLTLGFTRSIFGGYADDFATRDVVGTPTRLHATGVLGTSGGALALEGVWVSVPSLPDPAFGAVFALGATLTLRDVVIVHEDEVARGLLGSDAHIVAERVRVDVRGAGSCAGVHVLGGRLLLLRSRVDACAPSSGPSIGVHVEGREGAAAVAALVGDVVTVEAEGTTPAAAIRLEATATRALVAQSTIHVEASPGSVARGVDLTAAEAPAALALESTIVAASPTASDFACVEVSAGARVSLRANDLFAGGEGQCALVSAEGCATQATIAACGFSGCAASASNVYVVPGFEDAERHVQATSACVDAALPITTGPTALFARDMDGDARPQGAAYDIGADERVP